MPPRLSKRQQRELEELEALGGKAEGSADDVELDEAPAIQSPKAPGGFAAVRRYSIRKSPRSVDQET
jgi:hypothetical protein